jgi:hypothetical protein
MTSRILKDTVWRGKPRLGMAAHGWAWSGWVRAGRVDGRQSGFDSPATRSLGWAGNGRAGSGIVRLGAARLGLVWQGEGGWQAPRFEPSAPALHGVAGSGPAWWGLAGNGCVWCGEAWQGWRADGRSTGSTPVPPPTRGEVWRVAAWQGGVRYGRSRLGQAWHGWADGRSAGSTPAPPPLQGRARRGAVWLGCAQRGWSGRGAAMPGEAWSGMVPATEIDHGLAPWSFPASERALGATRFGQVRRGKSRSGSADQ